MKKMMISDSSSSSNGWDLPEDVVTEDIVSKLPITTLINLRYAVNKQLSSAIFRFIIRKLFPAGDDPSAGILVLVAEKLGPEWGNRVFYLSSSKSCLNNDDDDKLQLHYSLPPDLSRGWEDAGFYHQIHDTGHQFLGSVNGIVVFCEMNSFNDGIKMWNPATKSFKLTIECTTPDPDRISFSDFRYYRQSELFGCGFCAHTKDLRVVSIRSYVYEPVGRDSVRDLNLQPGYLVEVYSLITDSWRRVEVDAQLSLQFPPSDSVFYPQVGYTNDTFSWLVRSYYDNNRRVTVKVLTFHITSEVFQVTSLPDALLGSTYIYSFPDLKWRGAQHFLIQLLNGTIALIIPNLELSSFDIWLLLEYGVKDSWTKLCTTGPFPMVRQILGFWKNGKVLMESTSGELLLADLVTNSIIQNLQIKGHNIGFSEIILHKEIPFVL